MVVTNLTTYNLGNPLTLDLGDGVNLELRWVPPGEFLMGSPLTEDHRGGDEVQHSVTLTKGFWLGAYEVTQRQWKRVMGDNPSHFKNAALPVEGVSWDDCQTFLRTLNGMLAGAQIRTPPACRFRLPTEAEWEYACRAGTTGPYACRAGTTEPYAGKLDDMAWYGDGYGRTGHHAVGQKRANAWGLYDMHGNVSEWCHYVYSRRPQNFHCPEYRGGGWCSDAADCRSAYYSGDVSTAKKSWIGFRVVLAPVP